jgi:hypothetical protein
LSEATPSAPRAVAVLGGRRIDVPNAPEPRLPKAAEGPVRDAIRRLLAREQVDLLVSSAACGADLLGLQAAEELGVRVRIVLPFDVERFRRQSVTDRGGRWGPIYDNLIGRTAARGDLIVREHPEGVDAFTANNREVLREADAAGACHGIAILVWDGEASGPDDATADLAQRDEEAGFVRRDVAPLDLLP